MTVVNNKYYHDHWPTIDYVQWASAFYVSKYGFLEAFLYNCCKGNMYEFRSIRLLNMQLLQLIHYSRFYQDRQYMFDTLQTEILSIMPLSIAYFKQSMMANAYRVRMATIRFERNFRKSSFNFSDVSLYFLYTFQCTFKYLNT